MTHSACEQLYEVVGAGICTDILQRVAFDDQPFDCLARQLSNACSWRLTRRGCASKSSWSRRQLSIRQALNVANGSESQFATRLQQRDYIVAHMLACPRRIALIDKCTEGFDSQLSLRAHRQDFL